MNLGTIKTFMGRLLSDTRSTRWTAAIKLDAINRAQDRFVLDTRCLKDVKLDSAVADTYEYDLPTDILHIERVVHKGLELIRKSKNYIDSQSSSDWSDDIGTPKYYYADLDPDNKYIRVYPIPQAGDAGANNIEIDYIKDPADLSADSDTPLNSHSLLAIYHPAIAYKAAYELLGMSVSAQNIEKMNRFDYEYNKLVDHCINTWKDNEESTPLRMAGGRYHHGVMR